MRESVIFEAQAHQTLFLLEAPELRIITFGGEEALLLVGDFVALLLHVSDQPVATFARLPPRHLRAIAGALDEGGFCRHG